MLLTIILYGMGRSVINMSLGSGEKSDEQDIKLPFSMYAPQVILLAAAFILGIYMPDFISELFKNAAMGL